MIGRLFEQKCLFSKPLLISLKAQFHIQFQYLNKITAIFLIIRLRFPIFLLASRRRSFTRRLYDRVDPNPIICRTRWNGDYELANFTLSLVSMELVLTT